MAHRQSLLLCLLNGRTGLLVCAFEIYFSLFVRRGGRADNFLGAAPAFSGAVWGRSRPAAHGQGRCTVGCTVWRINYTPAVVCKSAEYSPWCIVCTKFSPKKCVYIGPRFVPLAGKNHHRGKGAITKSYLEKTTKHLVFPTRHLVFPTKHLVFPTRHLVFPTKHLVFPTKHLVFPTKHLVCKMLLSAKPF